MRTYLATFLILAASGIALAASEANAPPKRNIVRNNEMPPAGQMMDGKGEIRERFAQRHEEYMKWLEKNYPDDAKELMLAKEQNPDRYFRLLKESYDKYGRLAHADRTNPELARLIREDIELKLQTEKKLGQVRAATDENQKNQFTAELQQLVSKRFDNIVAQKQIRYQELNKKIEELKKEVTKQEADLDKLKAKKDEEVKKRIDELLNQTEEIKWD
jgi:hypothetical protein